MKDKVQLFSYKQSGFKSLEQIIFNEKHKKIYIRAIKEPMSMTAESMSMSRELHKKRSRSAARPLGKGEELHDNLMTLVQIDLSAKFAIQRFGTFSHINQLIYTQKINFCLSFIKSNLMTLMVSKGDFEQTMFEIEQHKEMKILNYNELYNSENFFKVFKKDNSCI